MDEGLTGARAVKSAPHPVPDEKLRLEMPDQVLWPQRRGRMGLPRSARIARANMQRHLRCDRWQSDGKREHTGGLRRECQCIEDAAAHAVVAIAFDKKYFSCKRSAWIVHAHFHWHSRAGAVAQPQRQSYGNTRPARFQFGLERQDIARSSSNEVRCAPPSSST